MGGGLCRPSPSDGGEDGDFPGCLALALSLTLPTTRSFVTTTLTTDTTDPFRPSHVAAFLTSSLLSPASPSPSPSPSSRTFARLLFHRYHLPSSPSPHLTQPELQRLLHDLLTHTLHLLPHLLSTLFSSSLTLTHSLLSSPPHPTPASPPPPSPSPFPRRSPPPPPPHLSSPFDLHRQRAEARLSAWLRGVQAREEEVGGKVWEGLRARGGGGTAGGGEGGRDGGGVTCEVFEEGWEEVSEGVMWGEGGGMGGMGEGEGGVREDEGEEEGGEGEGKGAWLGKRGEGGEEGEEEEESQSEGVAGGGGRVEETAVEVIAGSESERMVDRIQPSAASPTSRPQQGSSGPPDLR